MLRPFQSAASRFLQDQTTSARFLLDDAGLGKSASVLAAADALGLRRVLCVGPAVAGVSWPKEVRRWSPSRSYVDLDTASNFGFDLPGFYFVSYDTLSRRANAGLLDRLRAARGWDVIVLDEAQYLKNTAANRTQAVYGAECDGAADPDALVCNAHRVWVLSGTLTPNHAGEAYPHLRALLPATISGIPVFKGRVPERYEFENHFCNVRDTIYGRAIEGSKNQAELRAAMAPHFLRRRKKDVLPELPPLEFFTAPIKLDPATVRANFAATAAAAGFSADPALLTDDELADLAAAWDKDANLAVQRRSLGLAKVAPCAEWVRDRLAAGEPKVLLFAHHTAAIDGLRDALLDHNPVVYTGKTPPAERTAAVDRFQQDPECRVFVGNYHAAGTAVTLTAAKVVFFAEYSGTPGVNYQAACRAHRMGQRDGVQAYFGCVPNSLDERIARTAERRARDVAELFD